MLENLHLEIDHLETRGNELFQQAGVTAHTARISVALLCVMFLSHLILRFGAVPWPGHSLDSSASDLFLWGYLKILVPMYNTLPHTEEAYRR